MKIIVGNTKQECKLQHANVFTNFWKWQYETGSAFYNSNGERKSRWFYKPFGLTCVTDSCRWSISSVPLFFTWDLMEHSTVSRRGSQTPRDETVIKNWFYGKNMKSCFNHEKKKKDNCNFFFLTILTIFFRFRFLGLLFF